MGIDARLHVVGEVGIWHRRIAELRFICLRKSDALADFPAWTLRRPDDGHGTMVLLHNHLDALLDLGQHGMDIAGEFGFRNVNRRHLFDDTVSSLSPAWAGGRQAATLEVGKLPTAPCGAYWIDLAYIVEPAPLQAYGGAGAGAAVVDPALHNRPAPSYPFITVRPDG